MRNSGSAPLPQSSVRRSSIPFFFSADFFLLARHTRQKEGVARFLIGIWNLNIKRNLFHR